MRQSRRMTRCACQEVPFEDVLDHALRSGTRDFGRLCGEVGCGQICTACHCDLRCYLGEAGLVRAERAALAEAEALPSLAAALAV